MCIDTYHAPASRLRRFGSFVYFVALVAAILAACFVLAPEPADAYRFALEPVFTFDQAREVDVDVSADIRTTYGREHVQEHLERDEVGESWRLGVKAIFPVGTDISIRPEIAWGRASSSERFDETDGTARLSGVIEESRPTWGMKISVRYWIGKE